MIDVTMTALYFLILLGIILLFYVLIRLIRLEHRLHSLDDVLDKLNEKAKK
jgi:hypothetical protein